MNLVLSWAFRHHSLYVEEYESLDAAVGAAWGGADAGVESLAFIEVWDDQGHRILHSDEVMNHPKWVELDDAQWAAIEKPSEWVAAVEVLTPVGDPARLEWFTSTEAAEAAAERLKPVLGDRVVVKQLSRH